MYVLTKRGEEMRLSDRVGRRPGRVVCYYMVGCSEMNFIRPLTSKLSSTISVTGSDGLITDVRRLKRVDIEWLDGVVVVAFNEIRHFSLGINRFANVDAF